MNASDQRKLCDQGFTVIRRQDTPEPHLKYKSKDNPDSWKKYPTKEFTSKAERDRFAKQLLTQKKIIED